MGGVHVPSVVDRVRLTQVGFSPASGPGAWPRASYDHVVLHALEGFEEGAIAWWNRGEAGAHVIVKRSGELVLTCLLELVAWHAGTSATTGRVTRGLDFRRFNINPHSVGLELEGYAFDPLGFTAAQYAATIRFARWYRVTLGWSGDAAHTWLHAEISRQRADPGPYFDLARVLSGVAK